MIRYLYTIFEGDQRICSGQVVARDELEAHRQLRARGTANGKDRVHLEAQFFVDREAAEAWFAWNSCSDDVGRLREAIELNAPHYRGSLGYAHGAAEFVKKHHPGEWSPYLCDAHYRASKTFGAMWLYL